MFALRYILSFRLLEYVFFFFFLLNDRKLNVYNIFMVVKYLPTVVIIAGFIEHSFGIDEPAH